MKLPDDLDENALYMLRNGYAGYLPERPTRVIPDNWIVYKGWVKKEQEISVVKRYDAGVEHRKLPDGVRDPIVDRLMSCGYFIHDFEHPRLQSENSSRQKESPLFDVYLIGYLTKRYEGEILHEAFCRLGGFAKDGSRAGTSALVNTVALLVQSVLGEGDICFGGRSYGGDVDLIKSLCYRSGIRKVIGRENPTAIEQTDAMTKELGRLQQEIIRYRKEGSRGSSKKLDAMRVQDWITNDYFRLFHERARNTHIPLIDSMLQEKDRPQNIIGIYSPDYFRKQSFMGEYPPGDFDEPTYYGGLKEICRKHTASYITFMRPSQNVR